MNDCIYSNLSAVQLFLLLSMMPSHLTPCITVVPGLGHWVVAPPQPKGRLLPALTFFKWNVNTSAVDTTNMAKEACGEIPKVGGWMTPGAAGVRAGGPAGVLELGGRPAIYRKGPGGAVMSAKLSPALSPAPPVHTPAFGSRSGRQSQLVL